MDDGRDVITLGRSRQNNKTRPSVDVLDKIVLFCKDACTLEHDVDTHLTPRQLRRFTLAQNRIVDAINIQTAIHGVDIPSPPSINRVEFQKVGEIVSRQHVVYGREAQSGIVQHDLQSRPAYSSQAIDRDIEHLSVPNDPVAITRPLS
jgi:hypothetical protein